MQNLLSLSLSLSLSFSLVSSDYISMYSLNCRDDREASILRSAESAEFVTTDGASSTTRYAGGNAGAFCDSGKNNADIRSAMGAQWTPGTTVPAGEALKEIG